MKNKDNEENVEPNNEVDEFPIFKVYLKYKGYLTCIFCKLGINIGN